MKRVFVLGAGSSIGHSKGLFPKIDEFFVVANSYDLAIDLEGEYKAILDYVKERIGKDLLKEGLNFDIEAFFTYLEIEIERSSSSKLIRIREQLLRFIQKVFLGLGVKLKSSGGEYLLFEDQVKNEDTIISFNWDLLLDNVFSRVGILKDRYQQSSEKFSGHYWNFIMDLSPYGEDTYQHATISPPYKNWKSVSGFYLKMHGSIDWFYCSNNQCRAYLKTFPVLEPDETHFCSECHEPLKCLIIPPVLNKSYRQYPLIRRIWNVAAKELSIASEVIIWGYSLPPTDFYASWLLSQARLAPLEYLSIINPGVINKGRRITVNLKFIRHFHEIFRGKLHNTRVRLYENYSDYDDKIEVFQKYKISQETFFQSL